ncbi:MAG: hypothetical protein AAFX99_28405, partial [Myxococcota bacterium]
MLFFFVVGLSSCSDDDNASESGACIHSCAGVTVCVGSISESQCEEMREADCPMGIDEQVYLAGCGCDATDECTILEGY